jgi:hypothetical protein
MRTVVTILNILSSLGSLAMVAWGWIIISMGHFDPLHTDYVAVALGYAYIVPFLIVTPVCVVASIKLARQGRRSSIFVALIPAALVVLAMLAWRVVPWPGTP